MLNGLSSPLTTGLNGFSVKHMNCSICGRPIKDVRVTIGKVVYEMNVCAICIKPYIDRAALVKKIYDKSKKGRSSPPSSQIGATPRKRRVAGSGKYRASEDVHVNIPDDKRGRRGDPSRKK